ncbi:MAG: hypothetical protein JW829_16570 [Pirellulales bacterium]|nr:hypothetical protein [Pirellulales bacterium]
MQSPASGGTGNPLNRLCEPILEIRAVLPLDQGQAIGRGQRSVDLSVVASIGG